MEKSEEGAILMNKYIKKQTLSDSEIQRMIEYRRQFHKHPEIGYKEHKTSKFVSEKLKELGYKVSEGYGKTGVIGLLNENVEGKTLMLRADMDALALQELNDVEYKSQNDGVMHACGHDAHVSILLMVAEQLTKIKDKIKGKVKCLFQPAEEGLNGAKAVVKDGALENPKVDNVFGLHVFTNMDIGTVGVSSGCIMGGVDMFDLKIIGKGGHGALPHETIDPIVATANLISSMQTIISRNVDPMQSGVVTFGTIKGGTAFNIIPEVVELSGTVRTTSNEMHDKVEKRFREIVEGVSKAFNVNYELSYYLENYPTINNPQMTALVDGVAREVIGKENIIDFRTMGGEDMSVYLNKVPGCFFFIGGRNQEKGITAPHHNPYFDIDEDSLTIGAEMMLSVVKRYFGIE